MFVNNRVAPDIISGQADMAAGYKAGYEVGFAIFQCICISV